MTDVTAIWEKLGEIFDPWGGGSGGSEGVLVVKMLTLGWITYTVEEIQLEHPTDLSSITRGPGYETDGHLTLKYNASLILKKLGEEEPKVEGQNFYDVYSPKFKIRIECGHTDPARMIWSFCTHDEIEEFWVLQYPKNTSDSTLLYKFRPSERKKVKTYIEKIQQEAMEEMGKALR